MSRKTAQPWWADVQHLRPRAEREADEIAQEERLEGARRFAREDAESPRRSPHRVPVDPRDRAAGRQDRGRDAIVFAADVQPAAPQEGRQDDSSGSLAALLGPDRAAIAPVAMRPDPATEPEPRPVAEPAPVDDWLKPRHADARIENGRRTIEIRGQVDRVVGIAVPDEVADGSRLARRRRRRADRIAGRPDRVAMWAVLLGVVLILVAAFSDSEAAHGAVRVLDAGVAASGR